MKILNRPPASIPYIDRHRAIVNAKHKTVKGEINKTKQNLLTLDSAVASRYTDFELAIQNNQLLNFIENDFLKQIQFEQKTIKIHTDNYLITAVPFYNYNSENEFGRELESVLNESEKVL